MGSTTPRRGIVRSLAKLAVAVALVLGVATLPSSAAESPNFPGLPAGADEIPGNNFGWNGPKATGISEVAVAKQWARLPPLFVIARVPYQIGRTPSCRRGDFDLEQQWRAELYYISTDERAPEPYGYIGPFTVRTVAFGSIPVEAEVLIAQPRDEENLPVGVHYEQTLSRYCKGKEPAPGPPPNGIAWLAGEVDITTGVDIAIVKLAVDGVDLKLGAGCRPSAQSVMKLRAPAYYDQDPDIETPTEETRLTTRFFNPGPGGLLSGTVDIGRFAGCRTESGEDLSALLTATVSGDDNHVEVRSEGLRTESLACATDRSKCTDPLPGLPLPDGGEG